MTGMSNAENLNVRFWSAACANRAFNVCGRLTPSLPSTQGLQTFQEFPGSHRQEVSDSEKVLACIDSQLSPGGREAPICRGTKVAERLDAIRAFVSNAFSNRSVTISSRIG